MPVSEQAGLCQGGNVDKYLKDIASINKWYDKAVKEFKMDAIKYELANHECYYTGDISAAVSALGKGFTHKQVLKVYQEQLKHQVT